MIAAVSYLSDKLELYLSHRTALVDYSAPIVGCRAQAEEVVQEAWLRFCGQADSAAQPSNPVGYLYRIVRNLSFDLLRRSTLENRHPDGADLLNELPSSTCLLYTSDAADE